MNKLKAGDIVVPNHFKTVKARYTVIGVEKDRVMLIRRLSSKKSPFWAELNDVRLAEPEELI